jgi:hypothetical protein
LDSALVATEAKEYGRIVASGAMARTARNIAADLLTLPQRSPVPPQWVTPRALISPFWAMANLLVSQPNLCLWAISAACAWRSVSAPSHSWGCRRAYHGGDDLDESPEVVFNCPACAEREFGD